MPRNETKFQPVEKEFDERVVQVNRVSKKTKGGNRMSFSALVVVGDRKGRVGVGLGKAADVSSAVRKASTYAQKHFITVAMHGTTIPHSTQVKYGAAVVLLKPAPTGSGVIAGGAMRSVVEAAGIKDVVGKLLGSRNKITNIYATISALEGLKQL